MTLTSMCSITLSVLCFYATREIARIQGIDIGSVCTSTVVKLALLEFEHDSEVDVQY